MSKRRKNTPRYEHKEVWEDKWGRWESYEADYDEPYFRSSRKLRRNKIDGVFGGVCAGFGDYFGLDHAIMRILFVLSVIFLGFPLLAYFVLWVFIPKDKRAPYRREYYEARKAREAAEESHSRPAQAPQAAPVRTTSFRDVKSKFRSLETRLQDLERSVTSKEWKLRRDFRDLEN